MIFRNPNGYPMSVDDTMDSAVRISILNLADDCKFEDKIRLSNYEKNGILFRCPEGPGASANPNNCTLDQARMLIMAFYVRGYTDKLKRIWWAYFKRGFFGQNIDRDFAGSRKRPWPHSFYKDSNPSSKTFDFWEEHYNVDNMEQKNFDYRDPSGPDFWWVLTKAAKMYWFYPVAILGYPLHLLRLKNKTEGEFNQTIADCIVLGTTSKLNSMWNAEGCAYWGTRKEIEYAQIIERFVKGLK